MKTRTLLLFTIILAGGCCTKSHWPADVKKGVNVSLTVAGEANALAGKVLDVDGEWLKVEVRGMTIHIARDKVAEIMVVHP